MIHDPLALYHFDFLFVLTWYHFFLGFCFCVCWIRGSLFSVQQQRGVFDVVKEQWALSGGVLRLHCFCFLLYFYRVV